MIDAVTGLKMPALKLAEYEWEDETGLRHPSLVKLDVTALSAADEVALATDQILRRARVLSVKRIDSFSDGFRPGGGLDKRRVRTPAGYRFCWQYAAMTHKRYALFVAYRRRGEGEDR
jgi:hypothetical protein